MLGTPGPRAKRSPPVNAEALGRATAALNKVGSNLNQVAHRLNAGEPQQPCAMCGQDPCACPKLPCDVCGESPCVCKKKAKAKVKLANGKELTIQHMICTTFWHPDGTPMSAQQFLELLFGKLPEFFKDEAELR
jgi:hypothetical protein